MKETRNNMKKCDTPFTSYFQSRSDEIVYLLLKQLNSSEEPTGAGALQEKLFEYGLECSPATIGRYLRGFDLKKYTIQYSNQGRILTSVGRDYLAELESQLERAQLHDAVSKTMEIQDYDTLVDLLNARITIEKETSALAARNATAKEREELMTVLKKNRTCVKERRDPTTIALEFHRTIARISHNKFMRALLNMLIFEERQLEDRFETLISRDRGSEYLMDHEAITKAIVEGDDSLASYLMGKHLSVIINSFIQEKNKTALSEEQVKTV